MMSETKLKPQGMDLTADYTFSGAMTFDGTTLVVDDDNNRVGIGTASPAYNLDVSGDFHVSASGIIDDGLDVTGTITATDFGAAGFGSFTPWTAYTPTITGFGTVSVNNAFYRIVGDTMEIKGTFTSGTATTVPGNISLPSGFIVDNAKLPEPNNKTFLGLLFHLDNVGFTIFDTIDSTLVLYAQTALPGLIHITNRSEAKEFNVQNVTEYWTNGNGASYWASFAVTAS